MGSSSKRGLVVLLHGQPGAGVEWHRVADALGDSVDVLAPDRPGYGHNPLEAGSVEANVVWLAQLLEESSDGRAALIVAHSWAGGVALALALRRPDLARGLVLVGSVGPGAVTRMDRLLAGPAIGAAVTRPAFLVAHPVLRRVLVRAEPDGGARAELAGALRASRVRGDWRSFLTEQRALVHELPALLDQLDLISTPTMVVAGSRDHVVPFATATALAARLPHAELISVPGGGHLLHHTHPELIADVVRRVLADTARR